MNEKSYKNFARKLKINKDNITETLIDEINDNYGLCIQTKQQRPCVHNNNEICYDTYTIKISPIRDIHSKHQIRLSITIFLSNDDIGKDVEISMNDRLQELPPKVLYHYARIKYLINMWMHGDIKEYPENSILHPIPPK